MEKREFLIEKVKEIIKNKKHDFMDVGKYIFQHPELGGEEVESAYYLTEKLKEKGFKVSFPYEKLPTAFIAEIGTQEGVNIGFLAEYDALPGYDTLNGNAHACGHHWIAATMYGCAVTLAEIAKELGIKVTLLGTPAEETFGGKVIMAEEGAFDNIDIAMQAHLESVNIVDSRALAMNSLEFQFKGRAAHAASYPEEGINALDAVQLTFSGINALRQHLRQDVRIHGIVTEGGVVTNTVPDRGVCRITIRARDKTYLKYVRERVIKCAEGACLMTDAEVKYYDFENPYDDMINVPKLVSLAINNLKIVGITDFFDPDNAPPPGSSDVGNVSYICPTLYSELSLPCGNKLQVHDKTALELVNTDEAYSRMCDVILAYSICAIDLSLKPELLREIKEEHRKITSSCISK